MLLITLMYTIIFILNIVSENCVNIAAPQLISGCDFETQESLARNVRKSAEFSFMSSFAIFLI